MFMNLRTVFAWAAPVLLAIAAPLNAGNQQMPNTLAESLSGHEVILPSAAAGHSAVIVIGFSHGSSKTMEHWDKEIGAQVSAEPGVPLYNIAVIQDAPKFVRGMITHGIKALVPAAGQDKFLTVAQGQEELKKAVNFSSDADVYVVVLDSTGKIVFNTRGEPSEISKRQVINQIKAD
jgi:hypothetical protein